MLHEQQWVLAGIQLTAAVLKDEEWRRSAAPLLGCSSTSARSELGGPRGHASVEGPPLPEEAAVRRRGCSSSAAATSAGALEASARARGASPQLSRRRPTEAHYLNRGGDDQRSARALPIAFPRAASGLHRPLNRRVPSAASLATKGSRSVKPGPFGRWTEHDRLHRPRRARSLL